MSKFLAVVSLAVTVLSCQTPKTDTTGNLTRIDVIDGYNHPGIIKLSEIVSDVEFVQLEAVPDSELNISNRLFPRANDDKLFLRGWVNAHLTAGSSSLLFWENYFDTLYYLKPDGKEDAKYQLWFSKDNLPDNWFNDRSGQTHWDQLCYIDKIVDLPRYLILLGNYNQEEVFGLAFDKKTHQTVNISDSSRIIFENDLYQIPVFADVEVSYPEKIMYQLLEIQPASPKASEKSAKKQVRLSEKRDEFIRVLENRTENDNPLLILMKLR